MEHATLYIPPTTPRPVAPSATATGPSSQADSTAGAEEIAAAGAGVDSDSHVEGGLPAAAGMAPVGDVVADGDSDQLPA